MWYRERYAKHERCIEQDVHESNCYRLPEQFKPDDAVIDIGAHVGIFTMACAARGCLRVLSYEAHPSNFAALLSTIRNHLGNGRSHTAFQCYHRAVWRSDLPDDMELWLAGFDENNPESNTGGSTVAEVSEKDANGYMVRAIRLDTILTSLPRCRFLKLDCEGSEYPILATSRLLSKVDFIAVEMHEKPLRAEAMTIAPEVLPILLQNQGFKVEYGTERYSNILYASRL